MRVVLVHNYYQQPGGEDTVFGAEIALLQRNGHEVVKYIEDNRRIRETNRFVVATQTVWSPSSRRKMLQVLGDHDPDIVHFHNTFLLISPSAYSACRETGVPVVQTLHNYRLFCPNAIFYRDGKTCEDCLGKILPWPGVIHACYRGSRVQTAVVATMLTSHRILKTYQEKVDVYITLTQFARRKFIEGVLPEEKIAVKPNFVYPDPGMSEDERHYALFVGRLSSEKGIRTLLKSWGYIKQIPLKIVGGGPLWGELRLFVQTEKIECIEMLGRQAPEDVLRLMKGACFLVFPSEWYEAFPNVILEAFACGVPVIASRLGSMMEILEDGQTGLHFTPGDSEDLAVKVEWAWTHPLQMQEMGRKARAEFEAKYTAERNYTLLMEIYQRAMEMHC